MKFYENELLKEWKYISKNHYKNKVNEILNKQKQIYMKKCLWKLFNRLIKDSNSKNEERLKKSKITSDHIIMNDIKEQTKKINYINNWKNNK